MHASTLAASRRTLADPKVSWTVQQGLISKLFEDASRQAIALAIEQLRLDRHPYVRRRVLENLAEYPTPLAFDALIASLDHPPSYNCGLAACALGALGDRRAVEPLVALLGNRRKHPTHVRGPAACALGKLGDRRAALALCHVLGEADAIDRPVIEALDALADPGSIPVLRAFLRNHRDRTSLGNALLAVARIAGEQVVDDILDAAPHATRKAAEALAVATAESGGTALRERYNALRGVRREIVIDALALTGDSQHVPDLLAWLRRTRDFDLQVRIAAALGTMDWRPEKPEDKALLAYVRRAHEELRTCSDSVRLAMWLRASSSRHREVRIDALRSLAKLGGDAARARLTELLEHRDPWTRREAVSLIGRIADERAIAPLMTLLKTSRQAAAWNDDTRESAAIALGQLVERGVIDVPTIVEPLTQLLARQSDPGYRRHQLLRKTCAQVLARIGARDAIAVLAIALHDGEQQVRSAAAKALESLGWSPGDEVERVRSLVESGDLDALFAPGGPSLDAVLAVFAEIKPAQLRDQLAQRLIDAADHRAAEAILGWLFLPPFAITEASDVWPNKLRRLFGTYADVIVDAALRLDERSRNEGPIEVFEYNHAPGLEAVRRLAADPSPLATNLLHLVTRKQPLNMAVWEHPEYWTQFEDIAFTPQIEAARSALAERGG